MCVGPPLPPVAKTPPIIKNLQGNLLEILNGVMGDTQWSNGQTITEGPLLQRLLLALCVALCQDSGRPSVELRDCVSAETQRCLCSRDSSYNSLEVVKNVTQTYCYDGHSKQCNNWRVKRAYSLVDNQELRYNTFAESRYIQPFGHCNSEKSASISWTSCNSTLSNNIEVGIPA